MPSLKEVTLAKGPNEQHLDKDQFRETMQKDTGITQAYDGCGVDQGEVVEVVR